MGKPEYRSIADMSEREWNLHRAIEHLEKADDILSGIEHDGPDHEGDWDQMYQDLRDVLIVVRDQVGQL